MQGPGEDGKVLRPVKGPGVVYGVARQEALDEFQGLMQAGPALLGDDAEVAELVGKGATTPDPEEQAALGQGIDGGQVFGHPDRMVQGQQQRRRP